MLAPRWLALHVLVLAACAAMVLLGRWQWRAAHAHHGSVVNYSYAFQWWVFTGFALFLWIRLIRDARSAEPPAPAAEAVAYRRYVPPTAADDDAADDPERAAYNAYLASLADRDHE